MSTELVRASSAGVQAANGAAILPELVERAGGAARFAWEEFFYAEHHNPHTQRAYESAVRRFLSWCEGKGSSWPAFRRAWWASISSAWAARPPSGISTCQHCGVSSTALVQRHVVLLNPAASVSGVKETVVEGKTPEITIDQARKLIASVGTTYTVKAKGQKPRRS